MRLNYRARLIVGFSVAAALLFSVAAVSFALSADALAKYTPNETVFYVWMDADKLQLSWSGTKLIDRALQENGLSNIDKHLLGDQLAEACFSLEEKLACGLLLKVNDPKETERELSASGAAFKKLSRTVFAVSADPSWIDKASRRGSRILSVKLQKNPWRHGDITVYLKAPQSPKTQAAKILSLALGDNNEKIFCGESSGSKIILSQRCFWLSNLSAPPVKQGLSRLQPDISLSLPRPQAIIDGWAKSLKNSSGEDGELLKRLEETLKNSYGLDTGSMFWLKVFDSPQVIAAKKTSAQSGFFSAYAFFWKISMGELSLEQKNELEESLMTILAGQTPRESSIYLTDGTRVTELVPDKSQITRQETSGTTEISSPDGSAFFYKTTGNSLIIANDEQWLEEGVAAELEEKYFNISISSLPSNAVSRLLSDFQNIEYRGKSLQIR